MLDLQFIVDQHGNKTAVVVDLKKNAELWDDFYDRACRTLPGGRNSDQYCGHGWPATRLDILENQAARSRLPRPLKHRLDSRLFVRIACLEASNVEARHVQGVHPRLDTVSLPISRQPHYLPMVAWSRFRATGAKPGAGNPDVTNALDAARKAFVEPFDRIG